VRRQQLDAGFADPIALTFTDTESDAWDFDDHDYREWRVAAYDDDSGRIPSDLRQQRHSRPRHGLRSASRTHRVSCDQRCRLSAARTEQDDGQPQHAAIVRLPRSQSAVGHLVAGDDHDSVNRGSHFSVLSSLFVFMFVISANTEHELRIENREA
jgi:hypothetical protein